MEHYASSETDVNKCKNLVIELESIMKITSRKWKKTILFIDETNSFLDTLLTSDTMANNRLPIWYKLRDIIKRSKFVFCTDADTSHLVNIFIKKLRKDCVFLLNTYQHSKEKKVHHYLNENKMIEKMRECIKNKKYFTACFDSATKCEMIYEMLHDKKQEGSFLMYTAKKNRKIKNVNNKEICILFTKNNLWSGLCSRRTTRCICIY